MSVAVVEKGKGPGSHLLSGAMMKPSAMQKLFPDLDESDWEQLFAVDPDAWLAELDDTEAFYAKFGDRLPETLSKQLADIRHRLENAKAASA